MTSEWLDILDELDILNAMIASADITKELQQQREIVYSDAELVNKIYAFQRTKDNYEDVTRFGKYHPDYTTIMRDVRAQKRELDLHDKVAAMRLAENDFQLLLDEVSMLIGRSVSEAVKVPINGVLLTGCSSGCGTGGSCGCS